jgi:hypothetical protein
MVPTTLIILILVFFATSVISVVTGSTSLITIPVMISLGIDPRVAIATNMLALTLMSIGGFTPFVEAGYQPQSPDCFHCLNSCRFRNWCFASQSECCSLSSG